MKGILQAATRDAKPLHPFRTRGGNKATATWVARADVPPPNSMRRVKPAYHEAFAISVHVLKTWEVRKTSAASGSRSFWDLQFPEPEQLTSSQDRENP